MESQDKTNSELDLAQELYKQLSWARIFAIYALCAIIFRSFNLIINPDNIDISLSLIFKTYAKGLIFDLIFISYISFIPLIYYITVPHKFFIQKLHLRFILTLYFALIFAIIFVFLAKLSILLNLDVKAILLHELVISLLISAALFLLSYKNIYENIRREISRSMRFQLSLAPLLICITSILFFNKIGMITEEILFIAKQYGL